MEQLTLGETEAFARDVRDCMSCIGMFPPALDTEGRMRILAARFPGLARLFRDILYLVAKESFQRVDIETLLDNLLKAKQSGRSLRDAVAATHWSQARKYAYAEQWDTLTENAPDHEAVQPTRTAHSTLYFNDTAVQSNDTPVQVQPTNSLPTDWRDITLAYTWSSTSQTHSIVQT